jgi:Domain of unknown function (DUF4367)
MRPMVLTLALLLVACAVYLRTRGSSAQGGIAVVETSAAVSVASSGCTPGTQRQAIPMAPPPPTPRPLPASFPTPPSIIPTPQASVPRPNPLVQVSVVPTFDPRGAACVTAIAIIEQSGAEMATLAAKPRFVGVMNGIRFFPVNESSEFVRTRSPKCTTNPVKDAPPELERASPLNFTTGYLPTGTSLIGHFASACGDDVISLASDYRGPVGPLAIYRYSGPAAYFGRFAGEQMQALTINGRPAVIIEEKRPGGAHHTVVMSDEKGMWTISGMDMSRAEIIRIAEGIR